MSLIGSLSLGVVVVGGGDERSTVNGRVEQRTICRDYVADTAFAVARKFWCPDEEKLSSWRRENPGEMREASFLHSPLGTSRRTPVGVTLC